MTLLGISNASPTALLILAIILLFSAIAVIIGSLRALSFFSSAIYKFISSQYSRRKKNL